MIFQPYNKYLIVAFFILSTSLTFSQTPNSLKTIYSELKNATGRDERISKYYGSAISQKEIDLDSVIFYTEKIIELSKAEGNTLGFYYGDILNAYISTLRKNDSLAEKYLEKAVITATRLNSSFLTGNAYLINALIASKNNDFQKSLKSHLSAEYQFNKNDKVFRSKLINLYSVGFIYTKYGNFEKSLEYLMKSEKSVKHTALENRLGPTYNSLGVIFSERGEHDKSIEYFNQANNFFKSINDTINQKVVLHNIGIVYYNKKDFTNAKKTFNVSISKKNEKNYLSIYLEGGLYLGKISFNLGHYDKAIYYFKLLDAYSLDISSAQIYAKSLIERARTYIKLEQYDLAIQFTEKAIKVCEDRKFIVELGDAYLLQSVMYNKIKNYESEINFYKKYISIKDSIFNNNNNFNIESLKANFEYTQLNRNLGEQKKQIEILEERDKVKTLNNRLFSVISILVIVFLLGLLYNFKRIKDLKNERLSMDIENKSKQLKDFAIHITEKNDLLENIKKQITSVNISKENISINNLLLFINDGISKNKEKVQLYTGINNFNDVFYDDFLEKFPNLSQKEKRILILIRLGHNSKQIGIQLNVSPESINNYRYKLRKKLNLKREQNLQDFILNL